MLERKLESSGPCLFESGDASNILLVSDPMSILCSQVVSVSPIAQNITISLAGNSGALIEPLGTVITITSDSPMDENSFEMPLKVCM